MTYRLTDLAAALSAATDLAHGAPPEHQLRVAVIAARTGQALGLGRADLQDAFDTALLRWLGCTAVAAPLSQWMGDEIAAHRRAARFAGPLDPVLELVRSAGAGRPALQRAAVLADALRAGPGLLFASTCEAAGVLAARLGYGAGVVDALGSVFERFDGKGWPGELSGTDLPIATRVVSAAEDLITLADLAGPAEAQAGLADAAGRQHDPSVVAAVLTLAPHAFADLAGGDAWELVGAADPTPGRTISEADLDERLRVVADLVDLKVPSRAGRSREIADLCGSAAAALGGDPDLAARAGLLHALGTLAVPNDVWGRVGSPSSADRELIRLAPYQTERVLSHAPWLARFGAVASQYAERVDGSGHHRGLRGESLGTEARVLQAAERFRSLRDPDAAGTSATSRDAADRLRGEAAGGRFDARVVEAVVAAAGGRRRARPSYPDGLTAREVEVLALLARGLSNKEIAADLVITHRTVGHHVAHVYQKIGVSTRSGATLYAMRHHLTET